MAVAIVMHPSLEACLEDLEQRIDEAEEIALWQEWSAFARGAWRRDIFAPRRRRKRPPALVWPRVLVNAALDDYDAMALQQMAGCSRSLAEGDGRVLNVRCNYGTPIIPTLFGAELFRMADETDTLPASRALGAGGADALRRMLDAGEPSLDQLYINKVWEMGRRFKAIQARYPKIGRHVRLHHPDFQGPMDILEMLVGSEIFLLLLDEPDLVSQALDLITRVYVRAMRRWREIEPPRADGLSAHWGMAHAGALMLRDDSAMNLSPDLFNAFMRPHDQRLLDACGGGAMHACGRVEHFVPFLATMPGLTAFNMSQPQLNDMETIWRHTVDRGLLVLDANGVVVQRARAAGRALRGRVHVGAPTPDMLREFHPDADQS
jgi:hypothetical protein